MSEVDFLHTETASYLSPSVEVYPGANSNADVEGYGSLVNLGGSVPAGNSKISGDLLFSQDDGLVGFSVGTDIANDKMPEFHVGVSG